MHGTAGCGQCAAGAVGGIARRERYSLRQIAGTFRGEILPVVKYRDPFIAESRPQLSKSDALGLEMALQEDVERDPRVDSHQQHE